MKRINPKLVNVQRTSVRTNGCSTYWIGNARGMAVLATRATHDGSDFERRKRMATEQIGEPCHWESAEEENAAHNWAKENKKGPDTMSTSNEGIM